MARLRAQEAAARLSAAIFGGPPQSSSGASTQLPLPLPAASGPLPAGDAATGTTMVAAGGGQGASGAAPGVAATLGGPQELLGVVPDSAAGTALEASDKKDRGARQQKVGGSCTFLLPFARIARMAAPATCLPSDPANVSCPQFLGKAPCPLPLRICCCTLLMPTTHPLPQVSM